eukprot:s1296_g15.t1
MGDRQGVPNARPASHADQNATQTGSARPDADGQNPGANQQPPEGQGRPEGQQPPGEEAGQPHCTTFQAPDVGPLHSVHGPTNLMHPYWQPPPNTGSLELSLWYLWLSCFAIQQHLQHQQNAAVAGPEQQSNATAAPEPETGVKEEETEEDYSGLEEDTQPEPEEPGTKRAKPAEPVAQPGQAFQTPPPAVYPQNAPVMTQQFSGPEPYYRLPSEWPAGINVPPRPPTMMQAGAASSQQVGATPKAPSGVAAPAPVEGGVIPAVMAIGKMMAEVQLSLQESNLSISFFAMTCQDPNIDLEKMAKVFGTIAEAIDASEDLLWEADDDVFDLMGKMDKRGKLQLLDSPVCAPAFMRLLSLGKVRFERLRKGKQHDDGMNCPLDMRFVTKKHCKPASRKRALVFEFLNSLYLTCAEPIPDSWASNKRPRTMGNKYDKKGMNKGNIRQLPPGSFRDYFLMFSSQYPDERVSYKLFSSVT